MKASFYFEILKLEYEKEEEGEGKRRKGKGEEGARKILGKKRKKRKIRQE